MRPHPPLWNAYFSANCLICKTFLEPLQLDLVTNASSVYLFNNGLPVNYNARKNGGNNSTLDPTKVSLWASHSLSQSLSHPTHANPGCLPWIWQFYSQQFNHSFAMNLPGYFHPVAVTPCSTSSCMHSLLDFQDLPCYKTQCLITPVKKSRILSAWPKGFDSSHIDGEVWLVKEEGKMQKYYLDHQSDWLLKKFSPLFSEPSYFYSFFSLQTFWSFPTLPLFPTVLQSFLWTA